MRGLLPVAGSWSSLLTTLIPLALVIAISPLSLIPAVLVLHAPQPRPAGLAFLGGWLFGLVAQTVLFVEGSGALGGMHKSPPAWASWLRVVLGSALILFGIYRWVTRHRHTESPAWMRSFSTMRPRRAAITGLVLTVIRLEVLLMCLAAGVAIGTSDLHDVDKLSAGVIFVAVSASTVAVPILAYAAAGHRLDDLLERVKNWMEKNNAALLAAILVLIGLMVLHNGIRALYHW
ncbi:GAP family protein [Mycobacterium sp. Aquia_216]|uniref:GAP family protein n=1 Tax=Mycobacterium sp. Aquia_216 TaxID=2991729 RepID=UPI00227B8478|nr:GAP family protein [Mycobacterium sp. Aquia_216]WAJ47539.1 GAP family protein [Mycobacterium sp. Aquia_216]